MNKPSANEIKRGQTISFRVPSDTPDHLLKQLQRLKETERRNFSSKIAEIVLEGINNTRSSDRLLVTIPLPKSLDKAQRNWLKHEHSEALLGTIVYNLISDPIRATSLMASLNSNSLDIDEALYLQEEDVPELLIEGNSDVAAIEDLAGPLSEMPLDSDDDDDDDLSNFDWENVKREEVEEENNPIIEEMDIDDILGDFLSAMNK
jgi:hypothetical protein